MITLSGGLREYLSERRQASVAEMTLHFDASPDAVRGAVYRLAKGRARRLDPDGVCCGCGCGCGCKGEEVFEWLPDAVRP